MKLQRGILRKRRTLLSSPNAAVAVAMGVLFFAFVPAKVRAAAVGSPDVKAETKKKPPSRPLIKGPKKPLSLNEQAAAKAAQAAQAAKAAAATKPSSQPATNAKRTAPSKGQAAKTSVKATDTTETRAAREAKAKWPVAPKEPVNDVLVIDGGIANPDGSVTIGVMPDHSAPPAPSPAKAAVGPAKPVAAQGPGGGSGAGSGVGPGVGPLVGPAIAPAVAPSPVKTGASAAANTTAAASSAPSADEEDEVVISDDDEITIGEESTAAGTDGEVALDLGADVESGFNPYVFDRGVTWIFLPMFGLVILGLHLIPVPKRKMKKLIAQTGLFRGLPGKEETRTDLKAPTAMRRASNDTKPMQARPATPARGEVAVEIQPVPEPKPLVIPPRPAAATAGSSIGKVKVKPIPVAVPVKTEPKTDTPEAESVVDEPTRVAGARELPQEPVPVPPPPADEDEAKTRVVVSMAEQLAQDKEDEDLDDGDDATRLYVTKKTSHGGRDEG